MSNGSLEGAVGNEGKSVWSVQQRPRILSSCFMSEKWCMSEKAINTYWNNRKDSSATPHAFVIMPYNEEMNFLYRRQIAPMLKNLDDPLVPVRADTVMRTGYIICQKICLPILEADLVVADVTTLGNNELYELGFSIGLERKILLMARSDSCEGGSHPPEVAKVFGRWGLGDGPPCLLYNNTLEGINISSEEMERQKLIWQLPQQSKHEGPAGKIGILGGHNLLLVGKGSTASGATVGKGSTAAGATGVSGAKGFELIDALKSQLGNSLRDEICRIKGFDIKMDGEENTGKGAYWENLQNKQRERKQFLDSFKAYVNRTLPESEKKEIPYFEWMHVRAKRTDTEQFEQIPAFIESCDYVIVDITKKKTEKGTAESTTEDATIESDEALTEGMNLFWIGYCHGRGKNVIPVYCSDSEESSLHSTFDLQGLNSFRYDITHPEEACEQLIASCQIGKSLKEEARSTFWKPFFDEPQLKVFVGAVADSTRYGLNEWDYLTLAELNRYLSEAKPTLQNEIVSPVYQQPQDVINQLKRTNAFDTHLEKHIKDRNCIVIGSADANVMTELVLAKAFNIEPFRPDLQKTDEVAGCVTLKRSGDPRSLILQKDTKKCQFLSSKIHGDASVRETCKNFTFCNLGPDIDSPLQPPAENARKEITFYHSYGFMAYLKNPYDTELDPAKSGKILVLSGIAGPATLALAQMLTGAKNDPKPTVPSKLLSISGSRSYSDGTYTLKLKMEEGLVYKIADHDIFEEDLKVLLARYGEVKRVVTTPEEIEVEFSAVACPEEWLRGGEFHIDPDYDKMSLDVLNELNATIAEAKDNELVYAIVETLIEETVSPDDPSWRDRRRVLGWRLAKDREGQMGGEFRNPFTIIPPPSKHPFNGTDESATAAEQQQVQQ